MWQGVCVEVRRQLSGLGSFLPLCGFWKHRALQQVLIPARSSHQPLLLVLERHRHFLRQLPYFSTPATAHAHSNVFMFLPTLAISLSGCKTCACPFFWCLAAGHLSLLISSITSLRNYLFKSDCWVISLKSDIYINHSPDTLGTSQKREQKGVQWNTIFWTGHDHPTLELTCIGPSQKD